MAKTTLRTLTLASGVSAWTERDVGAVPLPATYYYGLAGHSVCTQLTGP